MREESDALRTSSHALRVSRILIVGLWLLFLLRSTYGEPVILGNLEVRGLDHLQKAQVVLASGLRLSQPITPQDVKAAAERLGRSGFFSTLHYRYATTGNEMTVTFEVAEAKPLRRCVFDNFVGIPEEELDAFLRKKLPMYSGELPMTGPALDEARSALEELLEERGVTADVTYTDSFDMHSEEQTLLFEISSEVYKIAALEFPGAEQVKPEVLIKASSQLIGQRYSRTAAAGFFRLSLLPIYRQRGYLQASFGTAVAEPIPGGADGGVLLSVPVSEGMQFHWAGADWQGNTVCSADELGELLSMRLGEIANGIKIDEGLQRIRDAYGRKGYIDLQTSAKATFVKKEATVAYTFTLVEGSAYRMGSLSLRGWPPEDERMLREAWKLRPGQVYDSSYLDTFLEQIKKLRMHAAPGTQMNMTIKPDPVDLTVNVTIETQ
jgi:outer membrane protein insertion porin family